MDDKAKIRRERMMAKKDADRDYKIKILRLSPVFADCADDDLGELAARASFKSFERNAILDKGVPTGANIYLLQSGITAEMHRIAPEISPVLTRLTGPSDLTGLATAFGDGINDDAIDKKNPLRFIKALINCSVLILPKAEILRLTRRDSAAMERIAGVLATETLTTGARLAATAHIGLEARLAGLLGEMADFVAKDDWQPTVTVGRISQSTFAQMLGVTREHVNRTLTMWESSGLIFQNKSGELVVYNRKRLAAIARRELEMDKRDRIDDWLEEIDSHLAHGLHQSALSLSMAASRRSPRMPIYKHRAVLAAARAGAVDHALALSKSMGLKGDYSDEDITCLHARLLRDKAFSIANDDERSTFLKESAGEYEASFDHLGGYYAGVNAAAGHAMAGDADKAKTIATAVAALPELAVDDDLADDIDTDEGARSDRDAKHDDAWRDPPQRLYWRRATAAECLLIAGEKTTAAAMFRLASVAPDAAPGKKSSTRKQLRRLAPFVGIDQEWIDGVVPQAKTLFFSGPMAGADLPPDNDAYDGVARDIANILSRTEIDTAYGALAAGSDLIIAKALMNAGVKLNVFLPLPPHEFCRQSVEAFGEGWRDVFIDCMQVAHAVDWSPLVKRASRAAFQLGASIAMGRAVRHSRDLETDAIGFFAAPPQDGNVSLSNENAVAWRDAGLHAETAVADWPRTIRQGAHDNAPVGVAAALILDEADISAGDLLSELRDAGFSPCAIDNEQAAALIFDNANDAMDAAAHIHASPTLAKARRWLDVGVIEKAVFDGADSAKNADLAGAFIAVACRPETERGETFATDAFVSIAMITPERADRFEYAGPATTRAKLFPCVMHKARL